MTETSQKSLNKVFYFNNKGTRKAKKTKNKSSIRKLNSPFDVQVNKRK